MWSRPTIREGVWFALLIAVLIAWYIEYRDDALARHRDAQAIALLKQQLSELQEAKTAQIRQLLSRLPLDESRCLHGDWPYYWGVPDEPFARPELERFLRAAPIGFDPAYEWREK